MTSELSEILTIGHSNHSIEEFIGLLRRHEVTAVADVRSQPYSKFNPQFNEAPLKGKLGECGVKYVSLGKELGARRHERECYQDGKALYERIAQTEAFSEGITRIEDGLKKHRIALMCSEKDPITCHRMVLIGRKLRDRFAISHILEDGELENNKAAELRLRKLFGRADQGDLFSSPEDLVNEAYEKQADKIAYQEKSEAEVSSSEHG